MDDLNLDLLPKKSLIIIEVLQFLLLIRIVILYRRINFVKICIVLLILFILHQLIIHLSVGNHLTIWISGLRYYLSFVPLLLLGFILGVKKVDLRKELKYLVFLVFIQVPVTIFQFFQAPKVSSVQGASLFDVVSGTMGGRGTNLLAAFLCFGILFLLINYFNKNKINYLIGTLFLILPAILGDAKGMIVLLFVNGLYLLFIHKISISRISKIAFTSTLLVVGFVYTYSYLNLAYGINLEFLITYFQSESGAGRLSRTDSIIYAFDVISNDFAAIFGYGVGSANTNPLGPEPIHNNFYTVRHSLDTLITETGLFGLIALVLSLVYSFIICSRVAKAFKSDKHVQVIIAKIVGGMILVLSVSLIWTDLIFRVQFMYPFGLLLGYTIGTYNSIKR